MTGDDMIKVGQAALKVAHDDKAEAAKQGKSPRHINPNQALGKNKVTVRLDTTDPAPFYNWCRERIKGKHKPMSLDILKSYAAALATLIAEVEAT